MVDVVVVFVVVVDDVVVVEVVEGDVEADVSTQRPSIKRSPPPGQTTLRHLLKKGSKSSACVEKFMKNVKEDQIGYIDVLEPRD